MIKKIRLVLLATFLISASLAHAGVTPLGLSIVPPLELPPDSFTITGARLSVIWGDNYSVYGIDLGAIGNMTDQNFVGIGVSGVFNLNKGTSTILGLQAAGVTNINVNKTSIVGLQVAGGLNSNQAESSIVGAQIALANYSPFTHVMGLQVGAYNRAHVVTGFQIGLINVVDNLQGIQIGLLNFNHEGLFAFAPILNVGF